MADHFPNSSPELTMIAHSMKSLNRFVSTGKKSTIDWDTFNILPQQKLNFSRIGGESFEDMADGIAAGTKKRKVDDLLTQSMKRHRDDVTGLDVCRLLRDKDGEVVDARAAASAARSQLAALTTAHSKLQLHYDADLTKHRLAQLKTKEKLDLLAHAVTSEKSGSAALREEACALRTAAAGARSDARDRVAAATLHYQRDTDALTQEVSILTEKVTTLDKILVDKTDELDVVEREVAGRQEEAERAQRLVTELRRKLMQAQEDKLTMAKLQAENKELQERLLSVSSQEGLARSFEKAIQRLPVLEAQVTRLQEQNSMLKAVSSNVRLLEEQLASATDRVQLLEHRSADAATTQAKLLSLQNRFKELSCVVRAELSLQSTPEPEELRRLLRGLRSTDQSLTDTITTLKHSVTSHSEAREALLAEVAKLTAAQQQQQLLTQGHVSVARRLQRKLILVSKERDSLKYIVSSYEAETTMTAASAVSVTRLRYLEENLEQYKLEIARLEEELSVYQQTPDAKREKTISMERQRTESAALKASVSTLEAQVSLLQEEKDVLEQRLEQRALRGDYDPSQVNVLHLKRNPMSEAVERYQDDNVRLEEEVKRLKQLLIQASSPSSTSSSTTSSSTSTATSSSTSSTTSSSTTSSSYSPVSPTHDTSTSTGAKSISTPAEEAKPQTEASDGGKVILAEDTSAADQEKLKELEKDVDKLEMKNQRLIEAFRSRSKEIREVVYRLLGYQVTPASEKCYKLSNMYASSQEDYFMFELASNGEIHLLSTDFSNSLEELIDTYLKHDNSYPAFLSAVTMDLFSQQTIMSRPAPRTGKVESTSRMSTSQMSSSRMSNSHMSTSRMSTSRTSTSQMLPPRSSVSISKVESSSRPSVSISKVESTSRSSMSNSQVESTSRQPVSQVESTSRPPISNCKVESTSRIPMTSSKTISSESTSRMPQTQQATVGSAVSKPEDEEEEMEADDEEEEEEVVEDEEEEQEEEEEEEDEDEEGSEDDDGRAEYDQHRQNDNNDHQDEDRMQHGNEDNDSVDDEDEEEDGDEDGDEDEGDAADGADDDDLICLD